MYPQKKLGCEVTGFVWAWAGVAHSENTNRVGLNIDGNLKSPNVNARHGHSPDFAAAEIGFTNATSGMGEELWTRVELAVVRNR